MAYTKQLWVNNDITKPLSADRLNYIETGIETMAAASDALLTNNPLKWAPHATGIAATDTTALNTFLDSTDPGDHLVFHAEEYVLNSTFRFTENHRYSGAGAMGSFGTSFKMADGTNLDAVWASEMWGSASVTPASEYPVIIQDISFDGNRANQTSGDGHGLVGMNFYARIIDVKAHSTRGDGIRWTGTTKLGNVITNNLPECHFVRLFVSDVGGDGFRSYDSSAGKIPDGSLVDSEITDCDGNGVVIDSAKGWTVSKNHSYATAMNGYKISRGFHTRVSSNYAEGFGWHTTPGTYMGINMSTSAIQSGAITTVTDNEIWANSAPVATTVLRGIGLTADNGLIANVVCSNNSGYGRTHTTATTGLLLNNNNSGATLNATVNGNHFTGWDNNYLVNTSGTVKISASANIGGVIANQTFSATPTIYAHFAAIHGAWRMILTGNVTSSTITDGVEGQIIVVQMAQDGSGNHTLVWPSNVVGAPTITSTASAVTSVSLMYLTSTDSWYTL